MLTYILGPLLSIFPKRWREALPFSCYVRWARATAISGIAESAAALVVLSHWYFYAMNTWVGRGVDVALNGALSGKSGPELRPQDIGGVALIVWASHPLTWLIGYFGLEGALRLGAAFTGTGLGTLPFFLVDRIFLFVFGTGPIRGFAVTLSIGLLSNLFTSTFVSKTLFELALAGKRQTTVAAPRKSAPSSAASEKSTPTSVAPEKLAPIKLAARSDTSTSRAPEKYAFSSDAPPRRESRKTTRIRSA